MAYDTALEVAVDETINGWPGFEKKRMFGGICYLLNGNMAFGILDDEVIVRCGPKPADALLEMNGVRPFDITGRAMRGWVMVASCRWEQQDELLDWLSRGRDFAASLPPK